MKTSVEDHQPEPERRTTQTEQDQNQETQENNPHNKIQPEMDFWGFGPFKFLKMKPGTKTAADAEKLKDKMEKGSEQTKKCQKPQGLNFHLKFSKG